MKRLLGDYVLRFRLENNNNFPFAVWDRLLMLRFKLTDTNRGSQATKLPAVHADIPKFKVPTFRILTFTGTSSIQCFAFVDVKWAGASGVTRIADAVVTNKNSRVFL